LVLLVAGVHWFGVAFTGRRDAEAPPGRRWKARWSLASVALTVVAFAAGTCVVGIVHQTARLLTDESPLYRTTHTPRRPPRLSEPQLRWIGLGMQGFHQS